MARTGAACMMSDPLSVLTSMGWRAVCAVRGSSVTDWCYQGVTGRSNVIDTLQTRTRPPGFSEKSLGAASLRCYPLVSNCA
ncbi:hypothetical protein GCM10010493_41090 [Streptomyces lavendulae subsp. grasserius]